jgi:transposase
MGSHRTPVSRVAAARGWARPTSSRYPSGAQRRALGNAHRCAVGRSARAVSAVPDFPQAFPGVGANGHATSGLGEQPTRLIGDKAYDSDKLDAKLEQQGIELIAPHWSNRTAPQTQDGRVLRRYVRRWKIERLFAWLGNFRRLLHRWNYHLENYTGFVQLGCMIILLRNYF